MQPSPLRSRITFQARIDQKDGAGNHKATWKDQFTVWGDVLFLKGGEDVLASRLQASQPAILRVRNTPDNIKIRPEWRAIMPGRVLDIREPSRQTADRQYLEMLVVSKLDET